MCSNVDFPEPEGPVRETKSPLFILKLTFFKTSMFHPGRFEQGPLEKFGFDGLFNGLTNAIIVRSCHKFKYLNQKYIYFKIVVIIFFIYIF